MTDLPPALTGQPLLPVKAGDKRPLIKGWQNYATTDPAVIESWAAQWPDCNWGITCGELLVVDIDRHGADGFTSLQLWEAAHGKLPDTLTSLTARGGEHRYYRLPAGAVVKAGRWHGVAGVDIKSGDGHQVVVPPSRLLNGGVYTWKDSSVGIATAPGFLVSALLPRAAVETTTATTGAELDERVPEGLRNETVFKRGCRYDRQLGRDRIAVEGAIRAYNANYCDPPLDDRELRVIIDSVFKQDHSDGITASTDNGADLEEQEYRREVARRAARRRADVEEQARQWLPPESLLTVKDELALPIVPPRYTVESLQREGHNALLTAQYKTGKTTVAGNYLRALVDGERFLDRFEVRALRGRVAFWNYELQPDEFRDYLRRRDVLNPDRASVLHLRGQRMPMSVEQVEKWIIDWLIEREVEVLILDPWARVMSGNGSENSNDDVTRVTEALDVIKTAAGVSDLLVTVHTPRALQEQGEERARGASRLDDWADARWLYTRTEDGARYLRAEGRGVALEESRLEFDPATERLVLAGGSRRENAATRVEDEVVNIVMIAPGQKTADVKALITTTTNETEKGKAVASAKRNGRIHSVDGPKNSKLLYPGIADLPFQNTPGNAS